MPSVTQRIAQVKQPRGGYVNPRKALKETSLGIVPPHDSKDESVSPGLVGIAVDYLTRFMTGTPVREAFDISYLGASIILEDADFYGKQVTGLDDRSIVAAIRLAGFDTVYRAGRMTYRPVEDINPNAATIENVRAMVESGLKFFEEYGPVTHDGLTFEGAYTDTVQTGDGDFMTADTLWDFKCSVNPPTNKHTLQVVMYWLMGLHSVHAEEYRAVKRLGFFNPRLGSVYTFDVADIPAETLHEIEVSVIGYDEGSAIF